MLFRSNNFYLVNLQLSLQTLSIFHYFHTTISHHPYKPNYGCAINSSIRQNWPNSIQSDELNQFLEVDGLGALVVLFFF